MARILFHTTLRIAEWAGCEELWFQAAQILVAQGHQVAACLPPGMHTPTTRARLSRAGMGVLSSPLDNVRDFVSRAARRLAPTTASAVSPCVRHAKAWGADLVVISQAACWSAYRELLALRNARIPYVTISQLNTPFVWPGKQLFECVGESFAGAKAAVFVSRGNLALFENQVARRLNNARVIYNPVSFPVDEPCGRPANDGPMVFLNVARIDPAQKGQDIIVDVMAMPKWRERDVRVRVAGGGDRAWLERLLAARAIKSVDLLGHVTDLRSEWQRSTFGLFSSRYEGMPLAMIEGMALARAVVATDVAGHREWIEDGASGFIAAGAEAAALDAAMERAWMARSSAATLGQRARAIYENKTRLPPAVDLAQLLAVVIE
jgi:glycosyltransferase involved in cell wall biosynthesis